MDKTPNENRPRRLLIRMTVPLGLRGPTFYKWLPIGPDNGIRLCRDGLELLLWLEAKASGVSEEAIPRHINLTAYEIYADITTTMDDLELLSYMARRDFSRQPNEEEEPLAERYETHGREVFSLLRDGLNRLLTFIRVEKGQFWLDPLEFDFDDLASRSVQFDARAQVGDGEWFRWQPSQTSSLSIEVPRDPDPRFLTRTDWTQAQAFVSAEGQPDLPRELLAAAEAFDSSEDVGVVDLRDDNPQGPRPQEILALQYEYYNMGEYERDYELYAQESKDRVSEQLYVSSIRQQDQKDGGFTLPKYSFPSVEIEGDHATMQVVRSYSSQEESEGQDRVTHDAVLEGEGWRILMHDGQYEFFLGE